MAVLYLLAVTDDDAEKLDEMIAASSEDNPVFIGDGGEMLTVVHIREDG